MKNNVLIVSSLCPKVIYLSLEGRVSLENIWLHFRCGSSSILWAPGYTSGSSCFAKILDCWILQQLWSCAIYFEGLVLRYGYYRFDLLRSACVTNLLLCIACGQYMLALLETGGDSVIESDET